ncbi:WD40-repeat-containing domain protein, partial [Baffinella frigidus]
KTVLLGKAALALDVVPNHDVQDWYDLSTDEFGTIKQHADSIRVRCTIKQHAGSIRVRRLFVPLAKWGEFERDRMARGGAPRDEGRVGKDQVGDKASRKDASTPIPPADKQWFFEMKVLAVPSADTQVIAGLYMAVLSGTGLAAPGQPQSKATANVKFDLGDHVGETNAKSYKSSLVWGDEADEFFMPTVDMRQKLRLYLTVHQEGNTERAAFMALNVSGFPFGEVYEDWHEMDINAGFYNLDPRVRLAFYRTHPLDNVPDKSVTCVYCGRDLPSQFQAAHLSVACSKFAIDCPHARVGCTWHGPRLGLENHVVKCPFEKLREAIYATTSEIQGIQGLLSDSAAGDARRNLEVADLNAMSAITPRLFKTYTGHKKPVTCMAGIKSTRQLASADEAGMIKLWSMQGDGELDSFRAHTGEVLCLHFTPEFPSKVFSGGAFPDDTIKIWDNSDFHCERKMLGGGNNFAINDLAALRVTAGQMEDSRLFSVDDSALLRAWDVETGTCIQSTPGHELGIKAVIARDQQIITGSLDMSARIWDVQIITGSLDMSARIWDVNSMTGSLDMIAQICDVRTLEHVATLDCIGDSVMALDFVQDWVLCAGTNSVKVWDITTRRLYRVLDGCRWPILFQDGLLYCAIHDSAQDIKVFDASHVDPKNWKVLDLLKGHSADVTALEWFNGTLCSASVDKTIKLWRAEP